jgi:hypothetical protein
MFRRAHTRAEHDEITAALDMATAPTTIAPVISVCIALRIPLGLMRMASVNRNARDKLTVHNAAILALH